MGLQLRDDDLAGLQQRFQVRKDERPAARDGVDQLGVEPVDLVRNGQLHGACHRLDVEGAAARALGLELRVPLVVPADNQATRRIDLEYLA